MSALDGIICAWLLVKGGSLVTKSMYTPRNVIGQSGVNIDLELGPQESLLITQTDETKPQR